ncbi:hypothetical protein SBOR_8882 [Sclerotinia borealis F-4128]|uniref:Uncharacterized protein n=1 Tax=Sclerotinia borealis (strain F-4128) TaxID=1432307 RepID=W9C1N1_SCLBF|nr:hypothetical protein SBOR_8882 [Sclerotinia borealis F-4128]
MGRNVGKELMRPSKKRPNGMRHSENDTIYEIERQIGDNLSVLLFSEHAIGDKIIIQSGHPPELNNALTTPHTPTLIFVQFMVLDAACLYCGIAVSVTALNNIVRNQEDPKTAMHHLSRAFRLINSKLSGSDAVADTTIAVVMATDVLSGRTVDYCVIDKFERHSFDMSSNSNQLSHGKDFLGLETIKGLVRESD